MTFWFHDGGVPELVRNYAYCRETTYFHVIGSILNSNRKSHNRPPNASAVTRAQNRLHWARVWSAKGRASSGVEKGAAIGPLPLALGRDQIRLLRPWRMEGEQKRVPLPNSFSNCTAQSRRCTWRERKLDPLTQTCRMRQRRLSP
jgi:hypothetical protein